MPTRRSVVVGLLAGLGGCNGSDDDSTGTPTAVDPPLDYETVTRRTPTPRPVELDVSTDARWPQFAADAANTGVAAEPGVDTEPVPLWELWTRSGAVAGPVVWGHHCFVGTEAGALLAVDRRDGSVRWRVTVSGGLLWSPATDGEHVVVHVHDGDEHTVERGGRVVAFDATNGERAWSKDLGSNPSGAPTIADDAVLVVSPYQGTVFCLELADGSVRWTADVSPVGPTIAVRDEVAYVAAEQERVVALDVASGEQQWEFFTGTYQPIEAAPVAGADYVITSLQYGPSALVLDRESGEKVWSDDTLGSVTASPALAGNDGVLADEAGTVISYDLETGRQQWIRSIGSVTWRPIAVVDGIVYLSTEKQDAESSELVALDVADGGDWWRVSLDGTPSATAVADGYLYLGTDGNSLYCFGQPASGGGG